MSTSQTDGGYDFEVAKNTLKQLPETLASTAGGVASTLVEGMGVTLERFQEIVTIAATSILSLGLPHPSCLPCRAPCPPLPPAPIRFALPSLPPFEVDIRASQLSVWLPTPHPFLLLTAHCLATRHGTDFRSMRALSSAATEALVKDIAARLESEPPPLPTSHSWSESPTTGKGSPCPSVSHEPSSPLRVPKVVIVP